MGKRVYLDLDYDVKGDKVIVWDVQFVNVEKQE